ncbi:MAG TPA: helix-turn-helix transcriptional regulator [Candidatus Blautia merdipullorum]|nr:helix-turn-helix transcriptional regulator [Candidatus Blautia merdipullorum]
MCERELHLRWAGKRTYSYCIQAARQLLADTQMPVTEIGYACGLGSPSYFGKVFRELTGDTPLQYRRKWQNNDKK